MTSKFVYDPSQFELDAELFVDDLESAHESHDNSNGHKAKESNKNRKKKNKKKKTKSTNNNSGKENNEEETNDEDDQIEIEYPNFKNPLKPKLK